MTTRLDKLKRLERDLEELMGKASSRAYAQLSREYRAVIKEIDELEGASDDDPIAAIVAGRQQGAD